MVPHIAEALQQKLKENNKIANESWNNFDNNFEEKNKIKIPIQINGKMRAIIEVQKDINKDDLEKIALKEKNILKFLNVTTKKVIVIPNSIVHFVI